MAWVLVVLLQVVAIPGPRICQGPKFDLDGDNVDERFAVVESSCGHGGCQYDLYLSRHPRIRVGRVSGCLFKLGKRRAFGVAELLTWWKEGNWLSFSRFRFNGKRFVESSR